jgi:hypothetical protein
MNEVRTICEIISFENKKKVRTRKGIFLKGKLSQFFGKIK